MAEPNGSGSMGMMVGVLLVLVLLVGGFFVFGGANMFGGQTKSVDVDISAPSVPAPSVPDIPAPSAPAPK